MRLLAVSVCVSLLGLVACEPRNKGEAVAPQPSVSAPPPPPSTTAAPSTSTTAPTFVIPGLALPGSPRQAIVGKWNVTAVDGKAVSTGSPGMGTDPLDPASYIAGTQVSFTETEVTLARGGATVMKRPYKVLSEVPPFRVTIDAGYGASNVDFGIDGSALWSWPSSPPHAVSMVRAQ
ncbi:MAG: hypothetical protein JNL79_22780 [Myxococcales bacterium]|nr:hypothetical protein [Myxococcales bacterium]